MKAKKFRIKCRAIDGTSTTSFDNLAAAGKYLSDRYQGPEYLSGLHTMGTDYAQYELTGFRLSDVGQFSFCDGYKDFQFYDWAGGRLAQDKRFCVVSWSDEECRAQKATVASFDTLEEAIAQAIKLCSDDRCFNVEDNGKDIGYAIDKQWIENVPFEQVAFAEESPAPF